MVIRKDKWMEGFNAQDYPYKQRETGNGGEDQPLMKYITDQIINDVKWPVIKGPVVRNQESPNQMLVRLGR